MERLSIPSLALITGLATTPACIPPETNCTVTDARELYTWSLKDLDLDEVQDAIEPTRLISSTGEEYIDGLISHVDDRFQLTINLESSRGQFTTADGAFILNNYLDLVYAFEDVQNLAKYVEEGRITGWALVDDVGNYKPGEGPTTEDLQEIMWAVDEVFQTHLSPSWTYIIRDDLHNIAGNDVVSHGISGPYDDDRVMIYTQYAATKGNVYDFAQNQAETSAELDLPYLLGLNLDFIPLDYTSAQSCTDYGSMPAHTSGRCLPKIEDIEIVTDAFSLCPDSPRGIWGLSGDYPEIADFVLGSDAYQNALNAFSDTN